jgi:putative protease
VKKPEIMSPAGYWPQLRAAVEAGADAVYFGLQHFTARAKVGFTLAELPDVMRTLHGRGVRGYLTFNTLVFEHELRAASEAIARVAEAGVDALIVQDAGVLKIARETVPGMELHASTQMSITDAEGVRFAQSLGAKRVTLARELSLEEVRKIFEQTGCDLEIFVHGALCVAYSGQCFSSEAWGGRSANRGQCAQACRLPYELLVDGRHEPLGDARYLLSPGDLSTIELVPEIVRSGVGALKIEGRYKDAEYVALTTSAYRRALDAAWAGEQTQIAKDEMLRLEQIYSRGLGPWFATGTNHQAVVRGRVPRHRGVLIGRVVDVGPDGIGIAPSENAALAPLKPGDGVVFDAADWRSPEEPEEGGAVYEIERGRRGAVVARFGNRAIDFSRVRVGDLVWRSHDPVVEAAARPFLDPSAPVARQDVSVRVVAKEGAVIESDWWLVKRPELTVTVRSQALAAPARNRGLSVETLQSQFARLGGSPYALAEIELDAQAPVFVPVSDLNEMRRAAVEQLQALQSALPQVEIHEWHARNTAVARSTGAPELHLLVRTAEQLDAAIQTRPASITLDYLDLFGLRPAVERVNQAGIEVRVASPRVLKPGEARIIDFLVSLDCVILVRATGILRALREKAPRRLAGDFSLNAANSVAAAEYLAMGIERLTPTHDLNAEQIAGLAEAAGGECIEAIAYQHLPVFHTEHCVFCRFMSKGTSYRDCGRPCEKHSVELEDRSGRRHPVMADVGCRNTVFGAEAQEASAHLEAWRRAGIRHFRLEFAHESADEVREVTDAFRRCLHSEMSFGELGRRLKQITPGGTTQGSLFVAKNYLELPVLQ